MESICFLVFQYVIIPVIVVFLLIYKSLTCCFALSLWLFIAPHFSLRRLDCIPFTKMGQHLTSLYARAQNCAQKNLRTRKIARKRKSCARAQHGSGFNFDFPNILLTKPMVFKNTESEASWRHPEIFFWEIGFRRFLRFSEVFSGFQRFSEVFLQKAMKTYGIVSCSCFSQHVADEMNGF